MSRSICKGVSAGFSPLFLQEGGEPEASPVGESLRLSETPSRESVPSREGAGLAQETFRRYREGMMEAGDCANGSVRVGRRPPMTMGIGPRLGVEVGSILGYPT